MENINLTLTWLEATHFNSCREKGFIELQWNECDDNGTGNASHDAWAVGNRISVHAYVEHVVINPATQRRKFIAGLTFVYGRLTGPFSYTQGWPHTELELDAALLYAQWQATVIFRLIEGDDAVPIPAHKLEHNEAIKIDWHEVRERIENLKLGEDTSVTIGGGDQAILIISRARHQAYCVIARQSGELSEKLLLDPRNGDEMVTGLIGGCPDKWPDRAFVDLRLALRAAREFCLTGKRDEALSWADPGDVIEPFHL